MLSADDSPGGMFRLYPIFQRLLSWSKPDAPVERTSREYEWYDQNSLLSDDPALRGLVPGLMDRSWAVPSRPEMEAGMAAFAEQAGGARALRLPLGVDAARGRRLAHAHDLGRRVPLQGGGVRDRRHRAVEVGHPRDRPGAALRRRAGSRASYEGKRVVVIGKRNSGFEIADGLLPWARQVVLVSPRPVQTSVLALSSVRVRYMQPLEDAGLGGGTLALDAAVDRDRAHRRTDSGCT